MLRPIAVRRCGVEPRCGFDQRLLYLLLNPSEEMIAKTALAIAEDRPTSAVIKAVVEVAIAQAEQ